MSLVVTLAESFLLENGRSLPDLMAIGQCVSRASAIGDTKRC